MKATLSIGVLALQGGIAEHLAALDRLDGVQGIPVSKASDLLTLDAIILPGGESTTMGRLLRDFKLLEPLCQRIASGLPTWGTCAGMILLAKEIDNDDRRHCGLMDITVSRNAYGSQLASFDSSTVIEGLGAELFPLVFIRAPAIVRVGPGVSVIGRLDGQPIACVERSMVATSFHPELTPDLRFHSWFVDMARRRA
ncbi:MAG: glutamine amidotransferase subunit PdxT [Spirochaetes bacterium GWB1_59_5]|nr:MAG: glutamine amidotransferase subunit PdxT [Spirochaetes bacterium GWB1_59_5]